ncbi:MAG: hypothetical protein ABIZ64_16290 [Casimicrobium sp.]
MTKNRHYSHPATVTARPAAQGMGGAVAIALALTLTTVLTGCVTPTAAPPTTASPPAVATVATETNPSSSPAIPAPARAPAPVVPEPIVQPKEPPPVELPDYARRGKRLPANGGAPGRAVASYCRSFEIDKDAATYFKTLTRTKRLPSAADVAERSRAAGQPQTVKQVVERDWALRRESNKSAPQRCKVLGGSIDGATALIAFEAELNGRRQRGIATVIQTDKKWRVSDHGDWVPVK